MSDWLHALPVGENGCASSRRSLPASCRLWASSSDCSSPSSPPRCGAISTAPETRLRGLIHRQIEDARDDEWPAMARRQASIVMIPTPLAEAMRTAMSLSPAGDGAEHRNSASKLTAALRCSAEAGG